MFKMREIKFRYRDIDGEFIYYSIDDIDKLLSKSRFCGQYSGLKDKNGKEIYEGDILEFKNIPFNGGFSSNENKYIEIVKFGIYEDDEGYSTNNHLGFFCGQKTLPDIHNHCKIIGNIYENKELLNA